MRIRVFASLALTAAAACAAPPADPNSNTQDDRIAEVDRSQAIADPAPSAAPSTSAQLPSPEPADPAAIPPSPPTSDEPPPVEPDESGVAPASPPTPVPAAGTPTAQPPSPPRASQTREPEPPVHPKAPLPPKQASPPVEPKPSPATEPAAPAPDGATTPSALASFEASQRRVLALAKADRGDAAMRAEVDRLLDYRWLAESSLGGSTRFAERCAPRCDDFEAALTELIRHNYLERVRDAERGTVEYTGAESRRNGTLAKVDTTVSFDDARRARRSLSVDYVMHRKGSGWKVRDLHVDGVSLAKTYRHEFSKMLTQGGIDLVIERLRRKLVELEQPA